MPNQTEYCVIMAIELKIYVQMGLGTWMALTNSLGQASPSTLCTRSIEQTIQNQHRSLRTVQTKATDNDEPKSSPARSWLICHRDPAARTAPRIPTAIAASGVGPSDRPYI
jgi:hypothetical protein